MWGERIERNETNADCSKHNAINNFVPIPKVEVQKKWRPDTARGPMITIMHSYCSLGYYRRLAYIFAIDNK